MRVSAAAFCAGLAAWCSLGSLGLLGTASTAARVALLPPWWLLPVFVVAVFGAVRWLRLSPREVSPLFGSTVILLPWLPFSVPPAALLWTGPFMVGVWLVVIAGVLAARGLGGRHAWLTGARRAPAVAATLALVLYGASAWWLSPILPEGDAPHYLILAQSLIKDGDLRIENNHRRGDYLEYSLEAATPDYLRRGVNGEIYSIHAPGLPAVVTPAMLASGYPGVVAWLGLIAALSTALVWHLAHRVTGSAGAAWFGWASCALTTPFFFQATQVFPDSVAATCLLLGTLPLIPGTPRETPSDGDAARREGTAIWLLSGASLAMLPWLQTRLAILAVAAACCLGFRIRTVRQCVSFLTVPVVSAGAWFGFFYIVYGTLDPTAPYGSDTQTTLANLVRALPALLFDQQFGLIPNAPVYGFILGGVVAGLVASKRWSWEVLVIVVPYMAAVGSYQMWWGGTTVPARLLTPLALVLAVVAARVWHQGRAQATRLAGLLALAASVVITVVVLWTDHGRLLFNFRDGVSLWLEWANDVLDLPRGLPSFFRDDPVRARLKIAIWIATPLAGWLALRAIDRFARDPRRDGHSLAHSWPSTWCLAVTLMTAFTLAWRADGVQPLTPETAQLGLLRHASPFRTTAYDYDARRFERPRVLLGRLRITTDSRRRVGETTLLSARDVPAGTYALHVASSGSADGTLVVHVGDTPLPFVATSTAGMHSLADGVPIRLPVRVGSIHVEGDAAGLRSTSGVELRPVRGDDGAVVDTTGELALRGIRYPSADAFFLDNHAYPEPAGFWVAGGRAARIVVGNSSGDLDLFVRNAPVDNTVTIEVDGQARSLRLRPGEERLVALPGLRPGAYLTLRIDSAQGFRPSETEPGNRDLRYLGCWVESRQRG